MLSSVTIALRISHHYLDIEIEELIASARLDLIQSGVSAIKANLNTDPLIKRAIILYCKAHFLADIEESARYQKSYDLLKIHLSLADDYKEVIPNVE